jgi:hypothetical protein
MLQSQLTLLQLLMLQSQLTLLQCLIRSNLVFISKQKSRLLVGFFVACFKF